MLQSITKGQAKHLGLSRYFTGEQCKHGHLAERYVDSGICTECVLSYYYANPDLTKRRAIQFARSNPDRRAAIMGKWAAKKRNKDSVVRGIKTDAFIPFYAEARRLTRETGIPHEVDHIIPLARGGKHIPTNLQVLTASDNARKGDSLCSTL